MDSRWFLRKIDEQGLNPEKVERLSLVVKLKEFFEDQLTIGGSLKSQQTYVAYLQHFFNFFNQTGKSVTLDSLVDSYLVYAEHLFQRSMIRPPDLDQGESPRLS
ncbi:hypothetical protein D5687_06445 [Guyparkeria sp. SCN-R1]|nr:hypothetical protein D5687_06445 [Guyparkeria sp. SCN-R1]